MKNQGLPEKSGSPWRFGGSTGAARQLGKTATTHVTQERRGTSEAFEFRAGNSASSFIRDRPPRGGLSRGERFATLQGEGRAGRAGLLSPTTRRDSNDGLPMRPCRAAGRAQPATLAPTTASRRPGWSSINRFTAFGFTFTPNGAIEISLTFSTDSRSVWTEKPGAPHSRGPPRGSAGRRIL